MLSLGVEGDVGVQGHDSRCKFSTLNSSKYNKRALQFAFLLYTKLRSIVNDIDLAYLAGYYKISDLAGTVSASFRYFLGGIDLKPDASSIATQQVSYELAFDAGLVCCQNIFPGGVSFYCRLECPEVKSTHPVILLQADINGYAALLILQSRRI